MFLKLPRFETKIFSLEAKNIKKILQQENLQQNVKKDHLKKDKKLKKSVIENQKQILSKNQKLMVHIRNVHIKRESLNKKEVWTE
jgi:hypothetical protein